MPADNIITPFRLMYTLSGTKDSENSSKQKNDLLLQIYKNMQKCMEKAKTVENYEKCYIHGTNYLVKIQTQNL